MCLYLDQNVKLMTATDDKLVFKVIELNSRGEVLSWFYNMRYLEGITCNSDIQSIIHSNTFGTKITVERAFHSYRLDVPYSYKDILYSDVIGAHRFTVGSGDNTASYIDFGSMIGVGLFAIPKGSLYYDNQGVCASNSIRYLGTHFSIQEWLSCKNEYIKKSKSGNYSRK